MNTWGVNDLVTSVDHVLDADVDLLIDEYASLYTVAPELRPGGDRHDSLRVAARIEAGLRSFLVAGRFGAASS